MVQNKYETDNYCLQAYMGHFVSGWNGATTLRGK